MVAVAPTADHRQRQPAPIAIGAGFFIPAPAGRNARRYRFLNAELGILSKDAA
jgi:hypothetical protein